MKLIKIIKKSIKKNQNSGNPITTVFGSKTATFRCTNKIPKNILKMVEITSETIGRDYECSGYIINPNKYDKLLKVEGMSIEVDNNMQQIRHSPEDKYFYNYENPKLECENCKNKISLSKIEDDYDDDGNHFNTCPKCQSINSFEELEYEKIENVVLKLGL